MGTLLEQELASIMKYALDMAGNPSPYYYKVPKSFAVPSIYFPKPEIATGGDTFISYKMDYLWFVTIFHRSQNEAYDLGLDILTAIKANRNLIPLIKTDGDPDGGTFRLNDPKLKPLDGNNAQLTLSWTSRRPYSTTPVSKTQSYDTEFWNKAEKYSERTISAAMEQALEKYALPAEKN